MRLPGLSSPSVLQLGSEGQISPETQAFSPSITNINRLVFRERVTIESSVYLPVSSDVLVSSIT